MGDPQTTAMGLGSLMAELSAFGLAIGFSPIHIGLLLLLLLGPKPLQRGGWFVLGWLTTAALAVILLLTVGHGLPGVVVGLAVVSIGSKLGSLYQTTFLLAFAYALLFLAKSVASMSSSLSRVPSSVKDVASTLGMNQWMVIKKVVAPIAAPGIGLGTVLVFLTAMKELPATLMLRPTGFDTLATQIWSAASINRFNEAAPYALILVLIAALPTFLLSRPDKEDRTFIQENNLGGEK